MFTLRNLKQKKKRKRKDFEKCLKLLTNKKVCACVYTTYWLVVKKKTVNGPG